MLALGLMIVVLTGLTAFMWHALTRVRGGGSAWWPWLANGHHNFWKTLLLGAMCIIPSILVVALLSWLTSLVAWPLWLVIATFALFVAAAFTMPFVSRSGAWPWWPARFPRVLAGLAMAAVGALLVGIIVSALVYSVPWGRLVSSVKLPSLPAVTSATPQVIEKVVEAQCPEPLERYTSRINEGLMNCPIENSTDSITPGQDRVVGNVVLGCDICNGKPYGPVVRGYVPTPPAPANPSAGSQSNIDVSTQYTGTVSGANCPTDGEMQALMFAKSGVKPVFTAVDWDPCKWNWQAYGVGTTTFSLPEGWEATVTQRDDVVAVYYGPVDLTVKGFTVRYLGAYNNDAGKWALDKCELLKRENDFGQKRNPAYGTVAGNFTCAGTTAATETSAVQASACGSKDASWMASNIGGKAEQWTPPDWEGGAWVFHPGKENWTELVYPGFGKLDVWIGGATTITASNANLLESREFDEASFHCK